MASDRQGSVGRGHSAPRGANAAPHQSPKHIERGEGEAVVFVHGARGDHHSWDPQVERFASDYRCISFDLKAHGDLAELVDRLGLESVSLVAQSAGGIPAMALAVRRPKLVKRLVLIGSIGTVDDADLRLRIADHRGSEDTWRRVADSLDPTAVVTTADTRRLDMPVLLVVGSEDPLIPTDVVAELTARLPNASCAVVPGAGHRPAEETPDTFNELLQSFFVESSGLLEA